MKKLLLVSAVLIGMVSASHAGVHIGFTLPLPPLPSIVIGDSAPVAPAPYPYYGYNGYGYGYGPGPVVAAPSYYPPPAVIISSGPYYGGYSYGLGYGGYYGRGYYGRGGYG